MFIIEQRTVIVSPCGQEIKDEWRLAIVLNVGPPYVFEDYDSAQYVADFYLSHIPRDSVRVREIIVTPCPVRT